MPPEPATIEPARPRSAWIDGACLAVIVVVYRALREELEDALESELFANGFLTLALREAARDVRAELPERLGIALAVLAVLGLAAWLAGRVWRAAPRGLPRPASTALRAGAAFAVMLPLALEVAASWHRTTLGRPPMNVVLIVIDTLRFDHLGLYGYEGGTSPRLDAFAREAFVFERALSNASWTRPAVASLLTSQTPLEHGIFSENRKHTLPESTPTLQRILRNRGHRTAAFLTSAHYRAGLDRDFDTLWNENATADKVYEHVFSFLEEQGDERFFLLVHNGEPHDGYSHREGFSRRPATSTRRMTATLLTGKRRSYIYDDPAPAEIPPDELVELKDNYDGEIRYLDHHLGRFFDELERRGLLDETVIAITADHGEEFFDHGSWWHGGTLYNELLHVPFILRVPGMGAGRIRAWVSGIDLLPTLAELVGASVPGTVRGRSLVPLLRGQPLAPAPILSATGMRRTGVLASVVVDGHKLIRSPEGETIGVFDLARDPGERVDLKDDAPLRRRLEAAFPDAADVAAGGSSVPMALDAATRQSLEALGYLPDPDAEPSPAP